MNTNSNLFIRVRLRSFAVENSGLVYAEHADPLSYQGFNPFPMPPKPTSNSNLPSNPPAHESNQGGNGPGRSGRDDPAAPQFTPEGQAIEDGSRAGTGNDGDQSRSAKKAVKVITGHEDESVGPSI